MAAGERHRVDSPSEPPGGANPADTSISNFWPPELRTTNFYCLRSPVSGHVFAGPGEATFRLSPLCSFGETGSSVIAI